MRGCYMNVARPYQPWDRCGEPEGYPGICNNHFGVAFRAGARFSEKRRVYRSGFTDLLQSNGGYALNLLVAAFGEGIISAERSFE